MLHPASPQTVLQLDADFRDPELLTIAPSWVITQKINLYVYGTAEPSCNNGLIGQVGRTPARIVKSVAAIRRFCDGCGGAMINGKRAAPSRPVRVCGAGTRGLIRCPTDARPRAVPPRVRRRLAVNVTAGQLHRTRSDVVTDVVGSRGTASTGEAHRRAVSRSHCIWITTALPD